MQFDIADREFDWRLTGLRLLEDAMVYADEDGQEKKLEGLLTDAGRHPMPSIADIHTLYERLRAVADSEPE